MKPETRGDPTDMELSREPSKSHQESERVTRDSAGVEKTGEDSVESCEPGKTHAKSWTRGETWESLIEPQETGVVSQARESESERVTRDSARVGKTGEDSVDPCEPGKTHAKS